MIPHIIIEKIINDSANGDSGDILNSEISEDEIKYTIRELKNNKNVLNKDLKSTSKHMLPVHVKLFNAIFDAGIIQNAWFIYVLKPIFKNKGIPVDPDNYRAITIVSNLWKIINIYFKQMLIG